MYYEAKYKLIRYLSERDDKKKKEIDNQEQSN